MHSFTDIKDRESVINFPQKEIETKIKYVCVDERGKIQNDEGSQILRNV